MQRVIGIFGSLTWSKTLRELIFNHCGEFRWSPEGPASQIHSSNLHAGAPGIFSGLLRSAQMLKWEWGAEVHYCPCISPPLLPILSKIHPVSSITIHLIQIHFNIILPSTSRPLFPSGFPSKILRAFLDSTICATCPAHLNSSGFKIPNYVMRRILRMYVNIK